MLKNSPTESFFQKFFIFFFFFFQAGLCPPNHRWTGDCGQPSVVRRFGNYHTCVKIPHTQGDVACNTYRNRYLKPTQPSRLGLPLALWFVRIQARCHLCSHNSTWKSFRVAAASGHLTGTAYGQAVKP